MKVQFYPTLCIIYLLSIWVKFAAFILCISLVIYSSIDSYSFPIIWFSTDFFIIFFLLSRILKIFCCITSLPFLFISFFLMLCYGNFMLFPFILSFLGRQMHSHTLIAFSLLSYLQQRSSLITRLFHCTVFPPMHQVQCHVLLLFHISRKQGAAVSHYLPHKEHH